MNIFFFLILIGLLIFLVPIMLLGGIVGRIFRPRGQSQQQNNQRNTRNERGSTWQNTRTTKRKKRIEDNEGEYIDFEEIDNK